MEFSRAAGVILYETWVSAGMLVHTTRMGYMGYSHVRNGRVCLVNLSLCSRLLTECCRVSAGLVLFIQLLKIAQDEIEPSKDGD